MSVRGFLCHSRNPRKKINQESKRTREQSARRRRPLSALHSARGSAEERARTIPARGAERPRGPAPFPLGRNARFRLRPRGLCSSERARSARCPARHRRGQAAYLLCIAANGSCLQCISIGAVRRPRGAHLAAAIGDRGRMARERGASGAASGHPTAAPPVPSAAFGRGAGRARRPRTSGPRARPRRRLGAAVPVRPDGVGSCGRSAEHPASGAARVAGTCGGCVGGAGGARRGAGRGRRRPPSGPHRQRGERAARLRPQCRRGDAAEPSVAPRVARPRRRGVVPGGGGAAGKGRAGGGGGVGGGEWAGGRASERCRRRRPAAPPHSPSERCSPAALRASPHPRRRRGGRLFSTAPPDSGETRGGAGLRPSLTLGGQSPRFSSAAPALAAAPRRRLLAGRRPMGAWGRGWRPAGRSGAGPTGRGLPRAPGPSPPRPAPGAPRTSALRAPRALPAPAVPPLPAPRPEALPAASPGSAAPPPRRDRGRDPDGTDGTPAHCGVAAFVGREPCARLATGGGGGAGVWAGGRGSAPHRAPPAASRPGAAVPAAPNCPPLPPPPSPPTALRARQCSAVSTERLFGRFNQ